MSDGGVSKISRGSLAWWRGKGGYEISGGSVLTLLPTGDG